MLRGENNTAGAIEIIESQLYWISDKNPPRNQPNAYFFCIDQDLVYEPFCSDFGPLDLGKTYRFVTELEKLLKDQNYVKFRIYHYTSVDSAKRANAAYLMGAFQVIILGRTADQAWYPFSKATPNLPEFRDASFGPCTYKCTILDCLRGLEYAIKLKWFDVKTFNLRDYEFYEKVENGDLNWVVPGKFIAFSGPSSNPRDAEGWRTYTPEDYVPIFKKFNVNLVVRLNNKQYDAQRFTKNGIKHIELYFVDGSCPSDEIVNDFIATCEKETGSIAVHCKAGLGRTGSLIACYAMKHFRFPAADFIGWIRIARPGSILGPQQQFLIDKQNKFFKLNETSTIYKSIQHLVRERPNLEVVTEKFKELNIRNVKEEKAVMSPEDKIIAQYGDPGQAGRLIGKKRLAQGSPDNNSPLNYSAYAASVKDQPNPGNSNTSFTASSTSMTTASSYTSSIQASITAPSNTISSPGGSTNYRPTYQSVDARSPNVNHDRKHSYNTPGTRYTNNPANNLNNESFSKYNNGGGEKSFDNNYASPQGYYKYTTDLKNNASPNKIEGKGYSPMTKFNVVNKK
jgi:cell division cycle 14